MSSCEFLRCSDLDNGACGYRGYPGEVCKFQKSNLAHLPQGAPAPAHPWPVDTPDMLTAFIAATENCIYRINGQCWAKCQAQTWCAHSSLPKVEDVDHG